MFVFNFCVNWLVPRAINPLCLFSGLKPKKKTHVHMCGCMCATNCHNLSFSLPQAALAGHFQNATVGFLQPIEDPITISFAALLFALNDRQNVSLVCSRLHSPPLCALSPSVSLSLYLTLSPQFCRKACHSLILPTRTQTSASVKNERGGKLQDCVFLQNYWNPPWC